MLDTRGQVSFISKRKLLLMWNFYLDENCRILPSICSPDMLKSWVNWSLHNETVWKGGRLQYVVL